MNSKAQQIQEIFKDSQNYLRSKLIELAELDAPSPALSMYTRYISELDKTKGLHRIIVEMEDNPERLEALAKEFEEAIRSKK